MATAQVLFDGAAGTLPQEQAWDYVALPGASQLTHTGRGVRLDTRVSRSEHAGLARLAPAPLDRTNGFALEFDLTLLEETHQNPHRAGFSVIVLDHSARGIELGFWTNRVFAQAAEPLFTHAEEAVWEAAAGPRRFAVVLAATNYVLFTGNELLLSGPIRDYAAFSGLFDVYETPDFLFLGDDTSSAAVMVEVNRVALITPVRLAEVESNVAGKPIFGWSGPPGSRFTVEGSASPRDWQPLDTVTSANGQFTVPFHWGETGRFLRVRYP